MSAAFPFFQFSFLALLYLIGINIGSERPKHMLKHAEKQSETRRVQSFGAKSGARAAKPWFSSFERFINRLSDLNSLDIAIR